MGSVLGLVFQMKHWHDWAKALEKAETVFELKKNTGGVKGIKLNVPVYKCLGCGGLAIVSPWTGAYIQVEAIK